ncbi:unnamed protein product, partial [Medioppia subpectinata]
VQHERGPRKPKYRDHHSIGDGTGLKVLHHHHHHHSPGIGPLSSPLTKAISALERHHQHQHHHQQQQHHTLANTNNGHNSHHHQHSNGGHVGVQQAHHQSPVPPLPPHTHHHIMSKIPPLISTQSAGDRHQDLLSGLFSHQHSAGANKTDANTCGPIGIGGPYYDNNPTAGASATGGGPPPGLLQMLLNAEKSQELIWNSIRTGAVLGHLHGTGTTASALPFGMSRLFDDMSLPPTSTAGSLFLPPFLSTSAGIGCGLFSTGGVSLPMSLATTTTATGALSQPSQSTTPSTVSSASGSASNGSHTPPDVTVTDLKSMSASTARNSLAFNGISFPPPKPLSLTGGSGGHWDSVHEVTARLLFMVIRWVKCLPTYRTLTKNDQITLLEDSWKDLFLLNMAQWSVTLDLVSPLPGAPAYLTRAITNFKATDCPNMAADIQYIQEIMRRFRQLSPDGTECSCLKAIVLFKPETIGLCDVQPVEMLQDQAQCILGDYVRHKYPRQPTRFGRLLLLMPCLRAIAANNVEKLFFKETIGEIPVEKLLGDMYHMEKFE